MIVRFASIEEIDGTIGIIDSPGWQYPDTVRHDRQLPGGLGFFHQNLPAKLFSNPNLPYPMKNMLIPALMPTLLFSLSLQRGLQAGEVFRRLPISEFAPKETVQPAPAEANSFRNQFLLRKIMQPFAVLQDAPGSEIYLDAAASGNSWQPAGREQTFLAIRSASGRELRGTAYLPKPDFSGMDAVPFTIPATARTVDAKTFHQAREHYYQTRWEAGLPGAAWFRHEAQEAAVAQGKAHADPGSGFNNGLPVRPTEWEDTFELFSGGRAVSENLQLERLMNIRGDNQSMVELSSLTGITTKEMNWKALLKDPAPATDPLAVLLPADQHALFFPDFVSMTRLLDEASAHGTPVLHVMESMDGDANTADRYQKQLCLGMSELSRLLGPEIIGSVAFTGSDPYLRVGSDLAILFETKQPAVLQALLKARQILAQTGDATVQTVSGETGGISYTGVVSPDRAVCSYLAVIQGTVVMTNSLHQIAALAGVAAGKSPALAGLDEYTFFRQRYARKDKDETAFLVLSDATIRRWCSPRWRIADSRRTLAAGVLAELTAAHFAELTAGRTDGTVLPNGFKAIDPGQITLFRTGPSSSRYGSLAFMTPISELSIDKVSTAEAEAYNRWRGGYEQNFSQFFDPIAIRLSISPQKIGAELTVMPLIAGTSYREAIALGTGAKISPGAGDPHGAILHAITAFNAQSEPVVSMGRPLSPMMPGLKANPLGWVGSSISVYLDDDAIWDQLGTADKPEQFLQQNLKALPVAIHAEVAHPLELAVFLTTLRTMVEQSAPGLTCWRNLEYKGTTYVQVGSKTGGNGLMDQLVIYYATTPKSLLITLNESLLKRALDREEARSRPDAAPAAEAKPWLGESSGLQAGPRLLKIAETLTHESWRAKLQSLAWANLPILNEWKRRFPDKDPVQLHEALWGLKLLSPGGGTYTWNAEWNTMESSHFGHPGQPKDTLPATAFPDFSSASMGLTFEPNGLSARGVVERSGKKN